MMMDNKGQASAELILLFGGIFVVVLLLIHMYKNYISDLSGEISSKEVNEFNSELSSLKRYFK
jgi:uncharacterized protein (UPF0333 family)